MSLFGLDRRVRRLRILAGEGALAAEDRAQLLRLAWEEEKGRLRLVLGLAIAVIGLTTVAVALFSVAIVVHFWDTPQRVAAAWWVAGVWIALWLAAVIGLVSILRSSSGTFDPARRELGRDWLWVRERFGVGASDDGAPREPRPATRDELLARIERQRQRVATMQGGPAEPSAQSEGAASAAAPPADESMTAAAARMAREHPIATGVATAATLAVFGPRRVLRWAAVLGPILWRMR